MPIKWSEGQFTSNILSTPKIQGASTEKTNTTVTPGEMFDYRFISWFFFEGGGKIIMAMVEISLF